MDAATFRQDFPEFSDQLIYPDSQVDFYLRVAEKLLPECRWGEMLPYAIELFVAHHLAIGRQNDLASSVGAIPGAVKGPTTSKAVDKVSVGYDAGSVALEDGGFWNLTTYGIRFLQLARLFGAGGVQL